MKAVLGMVSAAIFAGALALSPAPAQARGGGAVAAGVVGGLALGAAVGAAAANNSYYNGPGYVERHYEPVYGACHTERERFVDEWGRVHHRRIRVCD
jgi:hypothetical protein